MKTPLLTAALAGLFVIGAAAEASAWTRNGTVTTGRGTYNVQGGGSCANGACSGSRTVTGPNGNSVTRQGSITRVGPNRAYYTGSVTGPNGGTVYRRGVITRY
jgi:hypothetical protein